MVLSCLGKGLAGKECRVLPVEPVYLVDGSTVLREDICFAGEDHMPSLPQFKKPVGRFPGLLFNCHTPLFLHQVWYSYECGICLYNPVGRIGFCGHVFISTPVGEESPGLLTAIPDL